MMKLGLQAWVTCLNLHSKSYIHHDYLRLLILHLFWYSTYYFSEISGSSLFSFVILMDYITRYINDIVKSMSFLQMQKYTRVCTVSNIILLDTNIRGEWHWDHLKLIVKYNHLEISEEFNLGSPFCGSLCNSWKLLGFCLMKDSALLLYK